jgi:hypothetical protein
MFNKEIIVHSFSDYLFIYFWSPRKFPIQVVWIKGCTGRKSVPNFGASLDIAHETNPTAIISFYSQSKHYFNKSRVRCAASHYFKTFNSVALMLLLHLKFTCPPRCYYSARKFERTMMASLLVTQCSDHVLWTSIKVSVTEMVRQKKKNTQNGADIIHSMHCACSHSFVPT